MSAELTCRLEGVSKCYGRVRAVDDVTLTIGPGITALLGPNGAGKTTLVSLLATLQPADSGRVRLFGLDPSRSDQRVQVRRGLGYMPQEPGFHRAFSVFDFVDYVAILKEHTDRQARHAEVRRVLDLVGLRERADDRIRTLSGGMRRRVALAQALLGDPPLLLLDEPTAGLDPEQRLRFRDLISRLGEDRTVVVSTHQTEDVAALCQHVAVMHTGQVRFSGPPTRLTETARGRVWVADQRDPTADVAWRTSDGSVRHIGEAPVDATVVPPTIEDAYLLLVGAAAVDEGAAA
jgi:ABC-2 type transport system ATP-binding protein